MTIHCADLWLKEFYLCLHPFISSSLFTAQIYGSGLRDSVDWPGLLWLYTTRLSPRPTCLPLQALLHDSYSGFFLTNLIGAFSDFKNRCCQAVSITSFDKSRGFARSLMSLFSPGGVKWSWGGGAMLFMLINRQEIYVLSIHDGLHKTC